MNTYEMRSKYDERQRPGGGFARNALLARMQSNGLAQEDKLRQEPARGTA